MIPFLQIAAGFLAGACAVGLFYELRRLQDKVKLLEKTSRLRLPYKSYEELLDLLAELVMLENDAELKLSVIRNIRGHAANAMTVGTKREEHIDV